MPTIFVFTDKNESVENRAEVISCHWHSEGGAGRTGRHLLGAANGRKFLKIHVKIQIVILYVFACNKNKALQLHC